MVPLYTEPRAAFAGGEKQNQKSGACFIAHPKHCVFTWPDCTFFVLSGSGLQVRIECLLQTCRKFLIPCDEQLIRMLGKVRPSGATQRAWRRRAWSSFEIVNVHAVFMPLARYDRKPSPSTETTPEIAPISSVESGSLLTLKSLTIIESKCAVHCTATSRKGLRKFHSVGIYSVIGSQDTEHVLSATF